MKRYGYFSTILLFCLVAEFLIGCSSIPMQGTSTPTKSIPTTNLSPTRSPTSTTGSLLTTVDWANFTYFTTCYGNTQLFKTTNGSATNDYIHLKVYKPIFGDLTGDGQVEAVVPYHCTGVDSGPFGAFVYTGDAVKPRLIGDLPLPNTNGQAILLDSVQVSIKNEEIQLMGDGYSPNTPRCCPDLKRILSYRWNGSQFITVRSEESKI
jgi:hypothetical protein